MSRLIQVYLLHYPRKIGFERSRCRAVGQTYDWDLLGLILELRGYLYGGLEEQEIDGFLKSSKKLHKMKGLMGFYALLEDVETLKQLDSWLIVNLHLAMKKRRKILCEKHGKVALVPSIEDLITGRWLDKKAWDDENCPDPKLPSFVRGWRAARKYYYTFGLESIEPPQYSY